MVYQNQLIFLYLNATLHGETIGIYQFKVMSQFEDKIISYMNEYGKLDWAYNWEFICWSDSVSLKLLEVPMPDKNPLDNL